MKFSIKVPLSIERVSADITVVFIVVIRSWSSQVPVHCSVSRNSESTVVPASDPLIKKSLIAVIFTTSKL